MSLPVLLRHFSLGEWRHHAPRHAAALLAVALGVALALAVMTINDSALAEFSAAVRSTSGTPDLSLAAAERDGVPDSVLDTLAALPGLRVASPVIETEVRARRVPPKAGTEPAIKLRLIGIDPLRAATLSPDLMPQAAPGKADARGGAGLFDPGSLRLNAAAIEALADPKAIEISTPQGWQRFEPAGRVAAGGEPLAVVDIAAAQALWNLSGRPGRVSRIDLRLDPGVDPDRWLESARLPPGIHAEKPDDAIERARSLSRAYRVNLSVLALVALAVGGFLVYSVNALSVAQRAPQFALLGVLGLAARDRRRLVVGEALVIGSTGSALGVALGLALAALALRAIGGDLGAGYFGGSAPTLRGSPPTIALCALLGVAATIAGAWIPARRVETIAPAEALKGLGMGSAGPHSPWWAPALAAAAGLLALLPPIAGLPLAAYAAVALLLAAGVVAVPSLVDALLGDRQPADAIARLAVERARHARHAAGAAVAGIVASLALSVALTTMVASFRAAVIGWLDVVLPADVYLRSGSGPLPTSFVSAVDGIEGIDRFQPGRTRMLRLRADREPVALLAREIGPDGDSLPRLGATLAARPGERGAWISETAAAILKLAPGEFIDLPLAPTPTRFRIRGVYRDYARQNGAIMISLRDYREATGDAGVTELALWLRPGSDRDALIARLKSIAGETLPLDIATTAELRRISLAIFDRSFAVTTWLEAVTIGVGLVGIAAAISAQVLARRKEFGLLRHLGLTRRMILKLVAAESLAVLLAGTLLGLLAGAAVAALLVDVVNPQSFHWTMPLRFPLARLIALAGAVIAAGLATAFVSARRAGGGDAVASVREDW